MAFEEELKEIRTLESFLEHIVTIELENGAKAHLLYVPEVNRLDASISLNRGSLDEPLGQYGYQHILEHILFFGKTLNYSAKELKKLAKKLKLNPFVTFSKTSFEGSFSSRELQIYLDMVSQMIFSPGFKEKKNHSYYSRFVKNEVEKIYNFWNQMGVHDPDMDLFRRALLGNTRNAVHQVGNLATIGSIGLDNLIAYYDEIKFASASATELILVGNLPKRTEETIRKTFGNKPEGIEQLERSDNKDISKIEKPILIEHGTKNHPMFDYRLGWQAPQVFHADYYPTMALMGIFETEMLSKICEKYDVHLTIDYDANSGYVEVRGLLPFRKKQRIIDDLFLSFEELKSGYITKDKLEELSKIFLTSFKEKLEDPKERMSLVKSYIHTGRTSYIHCSSFVAISTERVVDAAKDWLPSQERGYAQLIRPAMKIKL